MSENNVVVNNIVETKVKEKPKRLLKNEKVWSEEKQKYFYRAPASYYREYYHRTKHEKVCNICGATVTSQMWTHQRGLKCRMIKELNELKQKVETIKIED